jgi:hypothetical protein
MLIQKWGETVLYEIHTHLMVAQRHSSSLPWFVAKGRVNLGFLLGWIFSVDL